MTMTGNAQKGLRNVFVIMLLLIIGLGIFMVAGADRAYAYKYKVTVYSGEQGTIGGKKVWSKEFDQGEHVTLTLESLDFELKNDKYYPRGFKIAGHDNDENEDDVTYPAPSFDVSSDVDYMITYGIKGALVKYFAKYVDTEGNTIRKQDTYYGMAGDKPVVSFRYIDGWTPQTYNIGKTLSKDESKNVMTFIYTKEGELTVEGGENGNGDNGAAAGDAGANGATAFAPGTPQNPAGTNVAPQNGTTIDDSAAPTTNPDGNGDSRQYTDLDDNDTPTASVFSRGNTMIIGSIAALLVLLALILFIVKRRKKEEQEPEA